MRAQPGNAELRLGALTRQRWQEWRLRRAMRRAFLLCDEEAREYVAHIRESEATKWAAT